MMNVKKSKADAGRLGGLATLKNHGVQHFRRLGKWGAHRMHATYRIDPWKQGDYALVHRETNQPVALLSGKPLE